MASSQLTGTKGVPTIVQPSQSAFLEKGKTGYFSLPYEIRIEIMILILSPGDIYLRPRSVADVGDREVKGTNPGIQLLSTCHQAYDEGHELFYSSNIFHLPTGPASLTKRILESYQLKHLAMIQHMAVTCSVDDLCTDQIMTEVTSKADEILRCSLDSSFCTYPSFELELRHAFGCGASRVLGKLWEEKLFLVLEELPWLKSLEVTLCSHDIDSPDEVIKKTFQIQDINLRETMRNLTLAGNIASVMGDAQVFVLALYVTQSAAEFLISQEIVIGMNTGLGAREHRLADGLDLYADGCIWMKEKLRKQKESGIAGRPKSCLFSTDQSLG